MAGTLIESLSGEFDPNEHHDSYREALEEVIEAKVEGHELVAPPERADEGAAVVDLMSALRASVDAAKAGRSATSAKSTAKPAKASAKKAAKPAKKTAAKKPAKAAKAAKPAAKKPARKSA
jgi:DNA end-binding protein Ku